MNIFREVLGKEFKIELTDDEIRRAYLVERHKADVNDVTVVMRNMGLDDNNPDYVEKIAYAYRTIVDEPAMDEGYYRDCAIKAIAQNPYPKKKFVVRVSAISTANIEVDAYSEKEARQIAWDRIPDLDAEDYELTDGSEEIDDVWEDDCT